MKQSTIEKLTKTQIISEYKNNATTSELANKYQISPETVRKFLLYNGIKLRSPRRRRTMREKPVIGTKYGQWTIISDEVKSGSELKNSTSRSLFWLCKCECGHVEWKNNTSLKSGKTKACKKCCKVTYNVNNFLETSDKLLTYKLKTAKDGIKSRKHRGRKNPLTFDLNINDITNIYITQNCKCALSGLDISYVKGRSLQKQHLSIDRINSDKGYSSDNIQLVDKRINMMKGSLSNEEFIYLCKCVAEYNSKCN